MKYLTILFFFLIGSCSKQIPFEKEKWNVCIDGFYENREFMIENLLSKNIIIGKKFDELEDIFGDLVINETLQKRIISQNIITDYGWDIDPVETLDLVIHLDKNNVAIKTELVKWKR